MVHLMLVLILFVRMQMYSIFNIFEKILLRHYVGLNFILLWGKK